MCLDGNGRYTAVNAKEGAKLAVAEGARNVVCVGAKPIAVTNCLTRHGECAAARYSSRTR